MKKIKDMSAWKRVTLFFACVLLLAGIILGRWFLLIEVPYIGYTKGFEKTIRHVRKYRRVRIIGKYRRFCRV